MILFLLAFAGGLTAWTLWGAAIAGAVLAIDAQTGWGGLAGLVILLFAYVSATGFIVANSIAGSLGDQGDRAGIASALTGAVQYGCGIFGSALVGYLADGTPLPMAYVIAVFGFFAFICSRMIDNAESQAHVQT